MEKGGRRSVGVAVDFSPCSKAALRWASDNLLRDGDHLVLIHIQPSCQYEEGVMQLWEATGSPLIPPVEFSDPTVTKRYGIQADEETLDILAAAAKQKGVQVSAKIYWGCPGAKLCEAVEDVPLSCLVIGSRGLNRFKRTFLGSVSNYVVSNAMCSVTVVKNIPSAHGYNSVEA
ncbi:hypothetical protein Taro_004915 [Colocasia esculenta]|uniref:UspA domain-containing protein n=1 Tax=Colocasia esculenta TaxID=4460 RepID=A0A843TT55_COLES|nr:hypothetical protein [Colocasia esculenta]